MQKIHNVEDSTVKNRHDTISVPPLLCSSELDLFREKTTQLLANLESNDIDSAMEIINEFNVINGENFYSLVGKLTRGLHDAISDLSVSSVKDAAENNINRGDLNYVIGLTDDAAKKTLDMTEQSAVNIQNLTQCSAEQVTLLENYLSTRSPDTETSALLDNISSLGQQRESNIVQLRRNNTEIMMAQNFQDLASQSITKAINIIKEVEGSLVVLTQYANLLTKLSKYSDKVDTGLRPEDSDEIKSNLGQLNSMKDGEHLDQGDVDNLLSSLGF